MPSRKFGALDLISISAIDEAELCDSVEVLVEWLDTQNAKR